MNHLHDLTILEFLDTLDNIGGRFTGFQRDGRPKGDPLILFEVEGIAMAVPLSEFWLETVRRHVLSKFYEHWGTNPRPKKDQP